MVELERSTVVHRSVDDRRRREAEKALHTDAGGQNESADASRTVTAENSDNEESGANDAQYAQPEGDEDRVLKNTRPAVPDDALMSKSALEELYARWRGRLHSAYGRHSHKLSNENGNFFGQRVTPRSPNENPHQCVDLQNPSEDLLRQGYFEPAYTNSEPSDVLRALADYCPHSVTPLWRCTLDYIFLIPPDGSQSKFTVTKLLPAHRLADMEPGLPRRWREPSDHMPIMAEMVL